MATVSPHSLKFENRMGFCKLQDLFCTIEEKDTLVRPIDSDVNSKKFNLNCRIKKGEIKVYDVATDKLIDESLYSVNYTTGLIILGIDSAEIRVKYKKLENKEISDNQIVTVDFYMYWSGKYMVMPFSFENYGLLFHKESFGFTTNNKDDIYGISALGLERQWIHVIAEFNNSDVFKNKMYINGIEKACSQRTGTTIQRKIQKDAMISGWSVSEDRRFEGNIDEFRIWDVQLNSTEIKKNMIKILPVEEDIQSYSNVIAYYRFDSEYSEIAKDYSYYRKDISLSGSFYERKYPLLEGYNELQEIIIFNPIKTIKKGQIEDIKFLIKAADPLYRETLEQLTFENDDNENNCSFYSLKVDKTNWHKLIDVKVW